MLKVLHAVLNYWFELKEEGMRNWGSERTMSTDSCETHNQENQYQDMWHLEQNPKYHCAHCMKIREHQSEFL